MPAVITEKSRNVSNQSQLVILPFFKYHLCHIILYTYNTYNNTYCYTWIIGIRRIRELLSSLQFSGGSWFLSTTLRLSWISGFDLVSGRTYSDFVSSRWFVSSLATNWHLPKKYSNSNWRPVLSYKTMTMRINKSCNSCTRLKYCKCWRKSSRVLKN